MANGYVVALQMIGWKKTTQDNRIDWFMPYCFF